MKYMMLIYDDPTASPVPGTAEFGKLIEDYGKFGEEVTEAGVMLAGEALNPVTTATTVRVKKGVTTSVDGPFAETKETLGGFYLLDCKDLDEAVAYAAKIPTAKHGSIEIRSLMTFD